MMNLNWRSNLTLTAGNFLLSKTMRTTKLRILKKREEALDKIIEGCKKNETYCQELLFKEFAPRILTVCRRYGTSHFGAKDILQETFLAVFKNIKLYDSQKASIETWMKRIAINTALKAIRGKKLQTISFEEYNRTSEETAENAEDVEQVSIEKILSVIQELPDGYRTVFNMYVIDGYAHKEIADILGISIQTSKSQLSKAKKMIRAKLAAYKKNHKIMISNGK